MRVPPTIIHFNRIFHYKPSILGILHVWKPPYCTHMGVSKNRVPQSRMIEVHCPPFLDNSSLDMFPFRFLILSSYSLILHDMSLYPYHVYKIVS